MTVKGDAKFKSKLTCGLKNNKRNLVNFYASSRKSENLPLDRILLSKAYKDLDEKIQKSYVSWHWRVIQNLKEKLTRGMKNDIRNLVNFHDSSRKFENLHFDGLLLFKIYKYLDEKVKEELSHGNEE